MVVPELVVGVRRLPEDGERHERRYELRFRDGGSASCPLPRLAELLGAGQGPADVEAVVDAADRAFDADQGHLLGWPSGRPVAAGALAWGASEVLRRTGGWIESSKGFRVRAAGRSGLDYVDGEGPLHVDAEWMATPTAVVHTESIPVERPHVLDQVVRAWLWAGYDVDLDPPT